MIRAVIVGLLVTPAKIALQGDGIEGLNLVKTMSRGEQTRTNSVVSKPGIILLTMRISTPIP